MFVTLLGMASAYTDQTVVECLQHDGNFTVLSKLLNDSSLTTRLSAPGGCV